MDVLNFVFSGFWTFLGCLIMLGMVLGGLVEIFRALRSGRG